MFPFFYTDSITRIEIHLPSSKSLNVCTFCVTLAAWDFGVMISGIWEGIAGKESPLIYEPRSKLDSRENVNWAAGEMKLSKTF